MKPNTYEILSRAVETGARYGVNRAYKHVENPTREEIADTVEVAIMAAISEVFYFESGSGSGSGSGED